MSKESTPYYPAKPLESLNHRQDYWLVDGPGLIRLATNWNMETGKRNCEEGRAFPFTPEGALGAALFTPK